MKLEFVTSKKTGKELPVLVMTAEEYENEREEHAGLCLACGGAAYGVEPDARRYECESCGEKRVYGLEEAMLYGRIRFTDEETDEEDDAQ